MRKNYIKFPTAFFDTKEWQKPRKYSKAEALLFLLNSEETFTVRELAYLWQWAKSSVQDFLNEVQRGQMLGQNSDKIRTSFPKSKNELRKTLGQNSDKIRTNEEPYLIVDNYYPPVLSIPKGISNTIPPKGMREIDFLQEVREDYREVVTEWLEYKRERKEAYKSQRSLQAFYNKLQDLSQGNAEIARKIIEQSMANNWAGIFRLKIENEKSKHTTNTAGNAEPDELLRAVAEGISRSRTRQEWQS